MLKKLFKGKQESVDPQVFSPTIGECVDITEVNDAAFSSKALGDGIAILPSEGVVKAPCDGKISMMFPTNHAFGIETDNGLELLVHIGIDTVQTNGEGFTGHMKESDRIKKGDVIVTFDMESLKEKYELPVMMVVTNGKEITKLNLHEEVSNNQVIMEVNGK